MSDDLVSISEAAEIKRVHRQTIRQAIVEGRIAGHKSGGVWLVERRSLMKYFPTSRGNRIDTTGQAEIIE